MSLFVSGGLSGIFLGTSAADIQLQDTYFVVAHFHLVMAIAPLFAAFGGLYFWFPKMFGRFMNETLGKIHFWFTFIGVYCVFFPMHILGIGGQMRRIYDPTQYAFLRAAAAVKRVHLCLGVRSRRSAVDLLGQFLQEHLCWPPRN